MLVLVFGSRNYHGRRAQLSCCIFFLPSWNGQGSTCSWVCMIVSGKLGSTSGFWWTLPVFCTIMVGNSKETPWPHEYNCTSCRWCWHDLTSRIRDDLSQLFLYEHAPLCHCVSELVPRGVLQRKSTKLGTKDKASVWSTGISRKQRANFAGISAGPCSIIWKQRHFGICLVYRSNQLDADLVQPEGEGNKEDARLWWRDQS
jgi:hypothetical protein